MNDACYSKMKKIGKLRTWIKNLRFQDRIVITRSKKCSTKTRVILKLNNLPISRTCLDSKYMSFYIKITSFDVQNNVI